MIAVMTAGIGTAMNDMNSSIGIVVTLKHASLLITQNFALYNNWKSRMHLYVGTWAKGVILNQEKNLAVKVVHISICVRAALGEAKRRWRGPDHDRCGSACGNFRSKILRASDISPIMYTTID